ncbi:MAG TPA: glycine betaine ABC transporter substrate-binding protein [Candidatus Yaniella excrementavium]|nr:glycine betaine ABC transporter substrate-binding protein [Candidatus Yaniella excrementavium]
MSTFAKKKFPLLGRLTAIAAVSGLALTACGDDVETADTGDSEGGGTINIAINHGWEEGIAVAELWALILEDEGYDVNKNYLDLAPSFSALSSGDMDFNMNIWQPVTHEEYLEEYGDDLEEVGVWNSDANQVIAVNEDAPIDSLDELADNADLFNSELVGIEPGAGLTERTEQYVIPDYGLEDWEFNTSSTPAMLQEVSTATEAGENIAVTLWMPHWAFNSFPIKPLEDPEESLGQEENMTIYARSGFSEDQPEVHEWLADFEIETERLQDLEVVLFEDEVEQDDYPEVIREWMDENQDWVDSLTS